MNLLFSLMSLITIAVASDRAESDDDILIEDFEASSWGDWVIDGNAFGDAPPEGVLPGQMSVSGFRGQRLVNTFRGGDASTGSATSPEFQVQRSYLAFLIGGGNQPDKLAIQLLVDDMVLMSATGAIPRICSGPPGT